MEKEDQVILSKDKIAHILCTLVSVAKVEPILQEKTMIYIKNIKGLLELNNININFEWENPDYSCEKNTEFCPFKTVTIEGKTYDVNND